MSEEKQDLHDRLLTLEVEVKNKIESIERRLNECSAFQKWIVGLLGVIAAGVMTTLIVKGL